MFTVSNESTNLLSENRNECVICLEPLIICSSYTFDCSHSIHYNCFHDYLYYNYDIQKNFVSCPICQKQFKITAYPSRQSKKYHSSQN